MWGSSGSRCRYGGFPDPVSWDGRSSGPTGGVAVGRESSGSRVKRSRSPGGDVEVRGGGRTRDRQASPGGPAGPASGRGRRAGRRAQPVGAPARLGPRRRRRLAPSAVGATARSGRPPRPSAARARAGEPPTQAPRAPPFFTLIDPVLTLTNSSTGIHRPRPLKPSRRHTIACPNLSTLRLTSLAHP